MEKRIRPHSILSFTVLRHTKWTTFYQVLQPLKCDSRCKIMHSRFDPYIFLSTIDNAKMKKLCETLNITHYSKAIELPSSAVTWSGCFFLITYFEHLAWKFVSLLKRHGDLNSFFHWCWDGLDHSPFQHCLLSLRIANICFRQFSHHSISTGLTFAESLHPQGILFYISAVSEIIVLSNPVTSKHQLADRWPHSDLILTLD